MLVFLIDGLVQCDISPNNFHYSMGAHTWELIDFDCARYCPAGGTVHPDSIYGTDRYIAPEVSIEEIFACLRCV